MFVFDVTDKSAISSFAAVYNQTHSKVFVLIAMVVAAASPSSVGMSGSTAKSFTIVWTLVV
jgi:hypothetical protein